MVTGYTVRDRGVLPLVMWSDDLCEGQHNFFELTTEFEPTSIEGESHGPVQRGVVKGSNKEGPGGDGRTNGYLPLGGGASTVHPANMPVPAATAKRLALRWPAVHRRCKPPNGTDVRFNVDQVQMPQPGSAIEPGKGAVPVNPFLPSGAVARVAGLYGGRGAGQVTPTAPRTRTADRSTSWLDRADGLVERRLGDARLMPRLASCRRQMPGCGS